ncbi:hypothetical protein MTR67_003062 [Solanum verrucosum]|uniref:RNase H type-1 domain-containing protein n=1 Tax=Solanum verrucosum TaxID=315347 RepID=A0AAF0PS58_SOLVR|nr:hypothetical protein MTR67_003062 [Solanum verrucosum]
MGETGGVIRDHLGCWIVGFSCKVKVVNAQHAKLLALLHGLNLAQKININYLPVETDSQVNAPTDGRINNEAYNEGG